MKKAIFILFVSILFIASSCDETTPEDPNDDNNSSSSSSSSSETSSSSSSSDEGTDPVEEKYNKMNGWAYYVLHELARSANFYYVKNDYKLDLYGVIYDNIVITPTTDKNIVLDWVDLVYNEEDETKIVYLNQTYIRDTLENASNLSYGYAESFRPSYEPPDVPSGRTKLNYAGYSIPFDAWDDNPEENIYRIVKIYEIETRIQAEFLELEVEYERVHITNDIYWNKITQWKTNIESLGAPTEFTTTSDSNIEDVEIKPGTKTRSFKFNLAENNLTGQLVGVENDPTHFHAYPTLDFESGYKSIEQAVRDRNPE